MEFILGLILALGFIPHYAAPVEIIILVVLIVIVLNCFIFEILLAWTDGRARCEVPLVCNFPGCLVKTSIDQIKMRAIFLLGHHDIGLCVRGYFFFLRLVLFSEEVVQ